MSIRSLWDLQEIDLALDKIARELATIERSLQEPSLLAELRQQLTHLGQEQQRLSLQQKDLELEIESLSQRIKDIEDRLYSGQITNPREIEANQQKVEEMRRRRRTLEDELIEVMLTQESLHEQETNLRSQLETEVNRWEERRHTLLAQQSELEQRRAGLQKRRTRVVAIISADILSTYETLRRGKHGLAVARLDNRVCLACGVEVPMSTARRVRYEEALVLCPTCGRILVP